MARIRGSVAAILNRRELVLNVGSDAGVMTGMKFAVLAPSGLEIKDPETGEPLGSVELPKVLVEATRVDSKLAVARTFRSTKRNVGGSGLGLTGASAFDPPRWVEEPENLRLKDNPDREQLREAESYVKIGDPVVQVVGDEFL
jgi:hypothetical protein